MQNTCVLQRKRFYVTDILKLNRTEPELQFQSNRTEPNLNKTPVEPNLNLDPDRTRTETELLLVG